VPRVVLNDDDVGAFEVDDLRERETPRMSPPLRIPTLRAGYIR
jgi:hypothetical protein